MRTIANENTKPIRQAIDIICGIDQSTYLTTTVSTTNFLDDYMVNAKLTSNIEMVPVADLAGEGFRNDGQIQPIDTTELTAGKYGLISEFVAGSDGEFSVAEKPSINIKWDKNTEIEFVTFILYSRDKYWKTVVVNSTSNDSNYYYCDYTFDEGPVNEHLYLNRIVVGEALVFTNDNLVSCDLALRGISAKLDELNLQVSEINITAYVNNGNDLSYSGRYSAFLENSPIYYSAGYVGDMSPLRKFYLSEPIVDNGNNTITIKGEDATKFLEGNHPGKFLNYNTKKNLHYYFEEVKNVLTTAGINYSVVGTVPEHADSTAPDSTSNIFIPNESLRTMIAKACFVMKMRGSSYSNIITNVQYVDAGIPTLYANYDDSARYRITRFEEPTIESEVVVSKIRAAWRRILNSTLWEDIETISEAGMYIKETSDPYYDFRVTGSGNSLVKITPYKYKVTIVSEGIVQGQKINFSAPTAFIHAYDDEGYAYAEISNIKGRTLTLGEIDGPTFSYNGISDTNIDNTALNYALSKYHPRIYTFKWRGDPKLQPGQIIDLHYGKPGVRNSIIKIDTITLEHANGGLSSTITGREITYYVD